MIRTITDLHRLDKILMEQWPDHGNLEILVDIGTYASLDRETAYPTRREIPLVESPWFDYHADWGTYRIHRPLKPPTLMLTGMEVSVDPDGSALHVRMRQP